MKSIVSISDLKKRLSAQYRSGNRWLVYDSLKNGGDPDGLLSFAGYTGAEAWCRAKRGAGEYRIRVLSDTLAVMNGIRPVKPTDVERRLLRDLLANRPVTAYADTFPLETGLLRQKYFPCVWNRWLEPLHIVSRYQLIGRGYTGQRKIRVMGSSYHFASAVTAFTSALRRDSPLEEERLLIGLMEGERELTDGDRLPDDGPIVFYRVRPQLAAESGDWAAAIEQVHDPAQPVQVKTAYFASYDRRHGQLLFFDGMLRKTRPGKMVERMDLAFFDFELTEIFTEL
jgi:hypothetical protein